MKTTIIAALALAAGLAGTAFAQTEAPMGGATGENGEDAAINRPGMPEGWQGSIADTFFLDTSAMRLREENEMRTRWSQLTPEQQARVREDCRSLETTASTRTGPKVGAESERTGGEGITEACDFVGKQ
jgi:hypothetical protein